LTTLKTKDAFVMKKSSGCPCVSDEGCTAGGGHFELKSKEICAEGKLSVTDAKNDCVASSMQMGLHET
jgi:hypothetical protein